MTPDDQERARVLMRRLHGTMGLAEWIRVNFPHEPPPPHLMPIIELVERARRERIKVCLSLPPRHGKTVTLLRALGWWLKCFPADTCAYYSYSDTQARSKSRKARAWARNVGIELDPSSKNVAEWRTTLEGGVLSGGLRGGLTGQGVSGLFIVDDPFKNREEADSLLIRDRVYEAFNEVVFTRLEGASVIVVHTRWHEDDLIGRLAKEGWEVLNIPAISEEEDEKTPPDILDREPDEALWPSRFAIDELKAIKKQIGDWSFAALYQGRPRPRGTQVFGEPARFILPRGNPFDATNQYLSDWRDFLTGKHLVIPCDPAASKSTAADYSVAGVLAFNKLGLDATCWVIDVIRGQWAIPVLVRHLRRLQSSWKCLIVVEAVAGFKAVPQMLKHVDKNLRIVEVHPSTDKFQRAQPVAAAWNDQRVLVPMRPEWVDPFLGEVQSFTGVSDATDDQVDMLAHGWNAMSGAIVRPPRRSRVRRGPYG
jgi:predicted phage terminase large subunit-like protein